MIEDTDQIITAHRRAICACEELMAQRKQLMAQLALLSEHRRALRHIASAYLREITRMCASARERTNLRDEQAVIVDLQRVC